MKMDLLSRIQMKEMIDMNISSFDTKVSSRIVTRGIAYYRDGHVTDFEQKSGFRFRATVEGSDMYEVEIKLDEQGNILYSYCDCPYDMGPVCKHEVAVYFYLKNLFEDKEEILINNKKKKENNIFSGDVMEMAIMALVLLFILDSRI